MEFIKATALWVLLALFAVLLCRAALLDRSRRRQGISSDEHFLVPQPVESEEGEEELPQEEELPKEGNSVGTQRWSSLPGAVWRLFLHQNPVGACLVHCAFTSCKLRVLLLVVDIVGALMLATVFFAASGVPQKRSRGRQDCQFDDPFELVGRILAIGMGSLLVAGIPTIVLGSLCTRGLKKLDYEGSPLWNKQLLVWRIQDRAIWSFGLLYLGFCIFFVCLFLANTDESDQGEWLVSAIISVVQALFVIPFTVALSLPLLSAMCLSFLSYHEKVKKEELVAERHTQLKRAGNMTLPVERI